MRIIETKQALNDKDIVEATGIPLGTVKKFTAGTRKPNKTYLLYLLWVLEKAVKDIQKILKTQL